MSKKLLPDIYQPINSIKWKHKGANGQPLVTLENIQCVISAYRITIARPPLNADDFCPFFGERYHANCTELVRDCHLAELIAICRRNDLNVKMGDVERCAKILGLETEDRERRAANAKRLRAGGAL